MNTRIDPESSLQQRLVFNRKVLIFTHVIVGLLSALWYLSRIDLSRFPFWESRAGLAAIFIASPAIVPYAVSAVYSWRVVTYRRLGVFFFILVVVAGAVLMGLAYSGALGELKGIEWFSTAAVQAGVYLWAAEILLHVV